LRGWRRTGLNRDSSRWRHARVEGNHRRQAEGAAEGTGSEVGEHRGVGADLSAATIGLEVVKDGRPSKTHL
jgi:hypothetical protein